MKNTTAAIGSDDHLNLVTFASIIFLNFPKASSVKKIEGRIWVTMGAVKVHVNSPHWKITEWTIWVLVFVGTIPYPVSALAV